MFSELPDPLLISIRSGMITFNQIPLCLLLREATNFYPIIWAQVMLLLMIKTCSDQCDEKRIQNSQYVRVDWRGAFFYQILIT